MTGQAVKLNRAKLEACLTCPLCNKLFNNATTISECLHTFCRGCIDKKLIDEQLKHCPVCNADLGCSPLDKLRTDHSLQDLRNKILPEEGKKIGKTPKNCVKRKKKSLSSLEANATGAKAATPEREVSAPSQPDCSSPKPEKVEEDVRKDEKQPRRIGILDEVSTKLTARRAKVVARKKYLLKELTSSCEPDKVTGDQRKENDDRFQLEISNDSSKARVQNPSKPDSSQQIVPNKIPIDNVESWQEALDLCEPLNSIVEAARKNKSCSKSTMQEHAVIPSVKSSDNDGQPKVENGDENESNRSRSSDTKGRKLKFSEDLNVPVQQQVITSNGESNRGFGPVWFSLVASEVNEESAKLPKITPSYLRVKDGSLLVSHIKMYIVKKLGLVSESEVEISLQGKPVLPCMQLQNLVELWLQTKPLNEKIQTHVGSSAKDFVMVLSYHRKS
ncbi:E3 ubiquitin protein ligase DRIP2-like [Arachis ipaensis]|nr:E3 ubiquitin protein ligase DRIP2-like [Arachis ipaensis]